MDLKRLREVPPWEWPRDTGTRLAGILRDRGAAAADRLLAADQPAHARRDPRVASHALSGRRRSQGRAPADPGGVRAGAGELAPRRDPPWIPGARSTVPSRLAGPSHPAFSTTSASPSALACHYGSRTEEATDRCGAHAMPGLSRGPAAARDHLPARRPPRVGPRHLMSPPAVGHPPMRPHALPTAERRPPVGRGGSADPSEALEALTTPRLPAVPCRGPSRGHREGPSLGARVPIQSP